MSPAEKAETKDRILAVAEELFSQYGYDGASIREIANRSESNIAAINYHFKCKENLYWMVMNRSHEKLEQGISEIHKRVQSLEELALETFNFVMKENRSFRNAMKLMLTDVVGAPDAQLAEQCQSLNEMGPPGYKYFVPLLKKECPSDVSETALRWGVKSIFSTIMWWSIFSCSSKIKQMRSLDPTMKTEYFRALIRTHVKMVEDTLRNRHKEIDTLLPRF